MFAAILGTVTCLTCTTCVLQRRQRIRSYSRLGEGLAVRAQLHSHGRRMDWRGATARRVLRGKYAGYIHPTWLPQMPMTVVNLHRLAPIRSAVHCTNEYELDFAQPRGRFSQMCLQLQVGAVAAVGLVTTVLLGRTGSDGPPREAYTCGPATGVNVVPQIQARSFMASLASPTAHPFQWRTTGGTVIPAAARPVVNLAGPGHTNTAMTPHSNSFTPSPHANTPSHQNIISSHTNADTRPVPGPL